MTFAGINYLAILIAAIVGWLAGAVWYMALGKAWVAAQGKTMEDSRRGRPRSRARPRRGCPSRSPSSPNS